jgi:uncharacterized protein (DUF924 family)
MALALKSRSDLPSPADVLSFWKAAGYDRWYTKDEAFDAEIRQRFLATWEAARDGRLDAWQDSDAGTLALLIVLDQFPRNLFRGDPRAFSTDAKARDVARRALAEGRDRGVDLVLRQFFYLPFEHSEDHADQQHCVALFRELGDAENLRYAEIHEEIIRRFGRFPHRNAVLGRATTADEQILLDAGGFAG